MYKRLAIICLLIVADIEMMLAYDFTNEHLEYEIVYHWGLIWKHAANATLEIKDGGAGFYDAKLCAHTLSWVDKIYKVRDTLYATIDRDKLIPIKYIKATHEKGYEGWDIVKFTKKNGVTYGHCVRIRPGKDDKIVDLSTEGDAFDMLSVFYMLRTLNMEKLKIEGKYRTTVFSGKRKEWVDIKYVGEEGVEMRDGNVRKSFHIRFSFTEEGKSKSSDDIDTWISCNEDRIPLKLRGSLPIGEVCVYFKE